MATISGAAFLASLPFAGSDLDPTELAIAAGLMLFGMATLVSRWVSIRRAEGRIRSAPRRDMKART